jgi:hypothetical protein
VRYRLRDRTNTITIATTTTMITIGIPTEIPSILSSFVFFDIETD